MAHAGRFQIQKLGCSLIIRLEEQKIVQINHLDLFSGIGGFSLAAKWAAINTIQFVENDKFCHKVLQKNFPEIPIHDDIKTFDAINLNVNIVTGGFPCQPFSQAGKKRGKNDNRYLWPEFNRIIKECNPDWVIIENVVGLAVEIDHILHDLERYGYESQAYIIPACATNAPHRRDRIWIIANAMRKRCNNGVYYWESRSVPKNKEWNVEAIQQKWSQFIPDAWTTFTARDWLDLNTFIWRGNNGLSSRMDKFRLKALGNAIVPQIAYVFMEIIKTMEY